MLEVADLIRLHEGAFRARFGSRLSSAQWRVLRDLKACRTAYFGGHLKQCSHCRRKLYAYHSCGNRHCLPSVKASCTQRWVQLQQERLLPCSYYLLTFTLPQPLRALALKHPRTVYGALLRCAASALQKLAADPRYVGGRLGCLAVLHTWTRALRYHPHVHLLVSAGGLSADRTQWLFPKNPAFLVPVRALSVLFRAQLPSVPPHVWKKNWVVHCQHAGRGQKVLAYLGRYLFRVALSNSRLERIDPHQVTFRFRDNRSQQMRRLTLTGVEFLRRFLLHVLPPRSAKVRYYGLFSPSCHNQLDQARALLTATSPAPVSLRLSTRLASTPTRCRFCRLGLLLVIEVLVPQRGIPP